MKQTKDISIKQQNTIFTECCRGIDTQIIHLTTPMGKKVFKFSYENGNAFEHFKGESFDGDKMNNIFILTDLGLKRNTSAYNIFTEAEFKQRVKLLTDKGIEFVKSLY
jgi:hypothetical protein